MGGKRSCCWPATWEPESAPADSAAEITLMSISIDILLKLLPDCQLASTFIHSARFWVAFYNWHSDTTGVGVCGWFCGQMRTQSPAKQSSQNQYLYVSLAWAPSVDLPQQIRPDQPWWVNAANSQPLDGPVDTPIPRIPLYPIYTACRPVMSNVRWCCRERNFGILCGFS